MNRRMTINVMTISLLLSLAPVSHGQPLEGCTTASFSQAAGSPVEVGSGPSSVAVGDTGQGKREFQFKNSLNPEQRVLIVQWSSLYHRQTTNCF